VQARVGSCPFSRWPRKILPFGQQGSYRLLRSFFLRFVGVEKLADVLDSRNSRAGTAGLFVQNILKRCSQVGTGQKQTDKAIVFRKASRDDGSHDRDSFDQCRREFSVVIGGQPFLVGFVQCADG